MKALLLSTFFLAGLPLLAQTSSSTSATSTTSTTTPTAPPQAPAAPSNEAMMSQVMSTLTPAEKNQLAAARTKAIADNPNLQTEGLDLMQKSLAVQSGTASAADQEALRTQATQYMADIHAAMLKADPTIEPVLQKIEAEAARLRAEYQSSH